MRAWATYADGTKDDFAGSSTWSSSNTPVATVGSSTGLVSGVSAGSATMLAEYPFMVVYAGELCTGGPISCPTGYPGGSASGNVTPTVNITAGAAYLPLRTGSSQGPNSYNFSAAGSPAGGTYNWTTSSSKVTLTNATSATVTVTAAAASTSIGDVPLTVTYTLNGQNGTTSTNISVEQPTSLQVNSDSTNATGHTCVSGTGTPSCSQSYFQGRSGSYQSYVRNRVYNIMDQFNPPRQIQGYNLDNQESYSTPSGQCAGTAPNTGAGLGAQISDCFYFCSATCQSGGSCSVSATQTITSNGFTVATKSVTWTCSGVTVSP